MEWCWCALSSGGIHRVRRLADVQAVAGLPFQGAAVVVVGGHGFRMVGKAVVGAAQEVRCCNRPVAVSE